MLFIFTNSTDYISYSVSALVKSYIFTITIKDNDNTIT